MNQSPTNCRIGQLALIVAFVLACHATVVALTSGPAGCGDGTGCADVISSKWAMVMGLPVALFGAVVYLVALLLSASSPSEGNRNALRCCGGMILMAAAYFVAIQIFRIGSLCVLCMATHGFAVLGLWMISRGRKTHSTAMPIYGLRNALPLLLAAGCVGGLAIVQSFDSGEGRMRQVRLFADEGREFPNDMFFKPFIAASGDIGVALDGGNHPAIAASIPEIQLGNTNGRQPLQVVMLNDWTCSHCIELHGMLHRIYESPGSDSLPAVTLRLLPVFLDANAEAAHRAMLSVHFGSGNPAAFPTLAREIAAGKITAAPDSIRARLSEIDSPTAERWETLPAILEDSVSQAFSLARAQMRLNSTHLKVSSLPQLTVFDAVLAGLPSDAELAGFLRAAASRQQSLLDSPYAPAAPETHVGCACGKSAESPDHVHGSSCTTLVDTNPSGESDAKTAPVDGPRLKFDHVTVKTRPIAMGEVAQVVFQFTNTGNRTLVVNAVHTGCGCITANDWSREIAPGERGSVSFTYDTNLKRDVGFGEHVRHVWVASNSVVRTDPSYGDQLEIKVPVVRIASHPGTLSMTSSAPLPSQMEH